MTISFKKAYISSFSVQVPQGRHFINRRCNLRTANHNHFTKSRRVGCKKFGNDANKCSFSFFLKTLFFISNLSRISPPLISSTLFPYYSANKGIRFREGCVCHQLLRLLLENKVFSIYFYERIFEKISSLFLVTSNISQPENPTFLVMINLSCIENNFKVEPLQTINIINNDTRRPY